MTGILWYHDTFFQQYIREKTGNWNIFEEDLGSDNFKKIIKLGKSIYNEHLWGTEIDRTGNIDHPFNMKIRRPHSTIPNSLSFEEICFQTAKEIKQNTNRNIAINWSGGIDSTVAIISFLETCDPKDISVILDYHSINEFSDLFYSKIKNSCNVISFENFVESKDNYFVVGGDAGDKLFGFLSDDNLIYHKDYSLLRQPWKKFLRHQSTQLLEFTEMFNSWSNVDINTMMDLIIWYSIDVRWQDSTMLPWAYALTEFKKNDITSFF